MRYTKGVKLIAAPELTVCPLYVFSFQCQKFPQGLLAKRMTELYFPYSHCQDMYYES